MNDIELIRKAAREMRATAPNPLGIAITDWMEDVAERHVPIGDTVTYLDGSERVERRQACHWCSGQWDCERARWPCADIQPVLRVARRYLDTRAEEA